MQVESVTKATLVGETVNTGKIHHTNNSAWDELSQIKSITKKNLLWIRETTISLKGDNIIEIRSNRPTTLAGDLDTPGNSNISAGDLPHEQLYWGVYPMDKGILGAHHQNKSSRDNTSEERKLLLC